MYRACNTKPEYKIMEYFNRADKPVTEKDTIVTAGKFDGVHRGHQILIERVNELAEQENCRSAALTFTTSPQAMLSHRRSMSVLDNAERRRVLERFGIDMILELRFTDHIRNLEPDEFIKEILVETLRCRAFIVGDDFCFGRNRAGNAEYLLRESGRFGIRTEVISKLMDGSREISSTYVREELVKGNIPKVNELLGYPFFAEGIIVHGQHNGHLLGFPTVNIIPDSNKILPPAGVYDSRIEIEGKLYKSITNIGVRPTFDGDHVTIETNIPGFDGDLYGKFAKVSFFEFKRPERRFGSLEELKAQIRKDVKDLGF